MGSVVYSTAPGGPVRFPPFEPGTTGLVARPNPLLTVACVQAPADMDVVGAPPLLLGDWHAAFDATGTHYSIKDYNDVPKHPGQTHKRLDILSPDRDPRAAYLAGLWDGQGYRRLIIYEAVRVAHANIVGRVAPAAIGCRMATQQGWCTLKEGMYLLQSHFNPDFHWLVEPLALRQQFSAIATSDGELVEELA